MPIEAFNVSADTPPVLFLSKVIRVILTTEREGSDERVILRVEDVDGSDLSPFVRDFTIRRQFGGRDWVELELMKEGFDGPFCTPAIDFR